MLGEDSKPAEFWASVGKECKTRGIKGIVWMGAHWECSGEGFEVSLVQIKDRSVKGWQMSDCFATDCSQYDNPYKATGWLGGSQEGENMRQTGKMGYTLWLTITVS